MGRGGRPGRAGETGERVRRAVLAAYRWLRPRPTGVVVGTAFFCASLTPSLLPRPWLAQALISGVALALGYGIGSLLGRMGRLGRRVPPIERRRRAVRVWVRGRLMRRRRPPIWVPVGLLVVVALVAVYLGSGWQRDLYLLMGLPAPRRLPYLRVPGIALGMLAGGVALVRAVRDVVQFIVRRVQRRIPPGPLRVFGITAALVIVAVVTEEVALGSFLTVSGRIFSDVNDDQYRDKPVPTLSTRSAGPGSLVTWNDLGAEGRSFVSGGPTQDRLRSFAAATGTPPATVQQPVRVYVGLRTTTDTQAAAALAVRELERTGGFDRAVLAVVTTTGTGWVDPYLAATLEYMYAGDTAMVGVQYSYLPSWISFLSERERVKAAGPQLFDQVYAKWSTLPVAHRPKLVVFAESLGSLGSEAGFRSLTDVRRRTQGVLWSGPTHDNPLWQEIVRHRDPGSPEVLPIYQSGRVVRFVSRPKDLDRPAGSPWSTPRVVYLQNPSDPVTWWTPTLLWHRPDWLEEPRGRDVLPVMRWFPVVTFVQITFDLALAYGAPPGHGHQFHTSAAAAWAAVTQAPGWTAAKGAQLAQELGR